MKRVIGLLVVVFALAIGTGSAMADGGGGGKGGCAQNCSTQSASLSQNSNSNAVAANSGAASDTDAVAVSGNNAVIAQDTVQVADDGKNKSSQSADLWQGSSATAVAVNTGVHSDTTAVAISGNNAFIDQDAFQFAFGWHTSNSSNQSVDAYSGQSGQDSSAFALAANTAPCADTDAWAISFNNGIVHQLALQLAFP